MDLTYSVEFSDDLDTCPPSTAVPVSSTNHGDGTATEVWRALTQLQITPRQFVRLKMTN